MSAATHSPQTGDWEALARRAARARDEGEAPTAIRELLSFRLDDAPYAIPVERVREIVRHRRITQVPRTPSWVLGVVALRGEVVQVVDLRMRIGLRAGDVTRRTRIIVLHGDEDRVTGVLVDAVDQVLRVEEAAFRAATAASDAAAVSELCLRDSVFVSVLDVDRVLDLRAD